MTVSTVNRKGQVTIPQKIREKLGIKEGSILNFEMRDNEIVIN